MAFEESRKVTFVRSFLFVLLTCDFSDIIHTADRLDSDQVYE